MYPRSRRQDTVRTFSRRRPELERRKEKGTFMFFAIRNKMNVPFSFQRAQHFIDNSIISPHFGRLASIRCIKWGRTRIEGPPSNPFLPGLELHKVPRKIAAVNDRDASTFGTIGSSKGFDPFGSGHDTTLVRCKPR